MKKRKLRDLDGDGLDVDAVEAVFDEVELTPVVDPRCPQRSRVRWRSMAAFAGLPDASGIFTACVDLELFPIWRCRRIELVDRHAPTSEAFRSGKAPDPQAGSRIFAGVNGLEKGINLGYLKRRVPGPSNRGGDRAVRGPPFPLRPCSVSAASEMGFERLVDHIFHDGTWGVEGAGLLAGAGSSFRIVRGEEVLGIPCLGVPGRGRSPRRWVCSLRR